MGFWDRLKQLLAGSAGGRGLADRGIYLYVRLERGGEVVRLRLDPRYELVPDDAGGYTSHKTVVGPRTYQRAEATFIFDARYRLTGCDISGGALVDEAAWQAQQTPPSSEDTALR